MTPGSYTPAHIAGWKNVTAAVHDMAGAASSGLPVGAVNTVISTRASFAARAFDIETGNVERVGGRPPSLSATCLLGR